MNVSFAQYLWALIAVRTRTFKVEKARADLDASSGSARSFDAMLDSGSTSCMVPYVDMMNHDFNYSARYSGGVLRCPSPALLLPRRWRAAARGGVTMMWYADFHVTYFYASCIMYLPRMSSVVRLCRTRLRVFCKVLVQCREAQLPR